MTRFLDTLMDTEWYERKLFVEASIATEDMRALNQFGSLGYPLKTRYFLIGSPKRCRIYRYMLEKKMAVAEEVLVMTEPDEIDTLSIRGAIALAEIAGLFNS